MFVRSHRIVTDQGIVDGILNLDEGRIVDTCRRQHGLRSRWTPGITGYYRGLSTRIIMAQWDTD